MYTLSGCYAWWDLITCPLPENAAGDILSSIQSTVVAHSPADCVVVTAFADYFPALLEKLYPRITLMMSHPEVNAQLLIRSLKPWGNDDDPDGENVLVISSDKEVLSYLKRLHRNNFNILVALPDDDSHSADLVPFASAVWHLSSLLDGKPPFLVRQNMVPSRAAKDKIGKHFVDLTNYSGKKLPGIGFKSYAKSRLKETTRVVSKPSGKNAQESQLGGITQGIKVVPRKIVSANTTTPGSRPVDLMGSPRDQIKGRCSLRVKKPALEEDSRGTKENIESHKSSKEGSKAGSNNIPGGRIGTARDQKNMGRCRIASPSDQNMGRCSPIAGKPAVKEVSHLGDSGKGSIEFHKSTKEISQGSTVVASKTGNANARTPGARLVNPNGGPRDGKCSVSIKKEAVQESRVRSVGKTRVGESKDQSRLVST